MWASLWTCQPQHHQHMCVHTNVHLWPEIQCSCHTYMHRHIQTQLAATQRCRPMKFPIKKSSHWLVGCPVHYSYRHCRHGGGHTTVWGGTFDRWLYALLSRVKQMSQLRVFCGPTNHFRIWLKKRIWLKCAPSNFWNLSQINLIYALLPRIQLDRDYALFGGHFWPKFSDRGH